MTKSHVRSRSLLALPALLVGTAGMLSFAFSAYAAAPDPYAQMQSQLNVASAHIDQIKQSRHLGEVLGASTTAPVRPVCRLDVDKRSYAFGENIQITWSTTGANNVAFVITPGQEGKDFQNYPQSPIANTGTASIKTSVLGLPSLTLQATSETGQTVFCTKYLSIVDANAGKKDIKGGGLQAQILKLQDEISKLMSTKTEIEQKITTAAGKLAEVKAKVAQMSTMGGHSSTTSNTKPALRFVSTAATLTVAAMSTQQSYGTYNIVFSVTAADGDVYIPRSIMRAGFSTQAGVSYVTINAASNRATADGSTTASFVPSSTVETSGNYFVIHQGESKEFTVSINYTPLALGYFKVSMYGLNWTDAPTHALKTVNFERTFSSQSLSYPS